MKSELDKFLGDLCVDLGFCLPPKSIQKMISEEYFEATQFANEVFLYEGMNPEEHMELWRAVRNRFRNKFGEEVDKNDY